MIYRRLDFLSMIFSRGRAEHINELFVVLSVMLMTKNDAGLIYERANTSNGPIS